MTGDRPTILFFSHTAELYGAERILLSIVREMRHDFAVHVALPADGPLARELAALEGVRLHRFTLLRFTKRPVDLLHNLAILIPFVAGVVRLLKQVRPDLVYCNTIRNLFTAAVAHWLGYPALFHAHERNLPGPAGRLFAWIAARACDVIVFVCEYAARSYTDIVPSLAARSRVIYNGVAVPQQPPPSQPRKEAFPLLMTIAQLAPHKRLDDLLRAMPQVVARYPSAHLVVFGEGDDRPKLEGLIAELSLGNHVTLAGFVPDAAGRLADADIYLAPFAGEGLNTTAIEAMLNRKPVIAAASGGLLEIVEEGETGLFHEVGDYGQIAAHVEYLAQSTELRREMGENGRQRAGRLFDPQRQMEKIRGIVEELAKKR